MTKILNYFKDSFIELKHNVSWSTMQEIQLFTKIVIISLLLITFIILIMDKLSEFSIVNLYYNNI